MVQYHHQCACLILTVQNLLCPGIKLLTSFVFKHYQKLKKNSISQQKMGWWVVMTYCFWMNEHDKKMNLWWFFSAGAWLIFLSKRTSKLKPLNHISDTYLCSDIFLTYTFYCKNLSKLHTKSFGHKNKHFSAAWRDFKLQRAVRISFLCAWSVQLAKFEFCSRSLTTGTPFKREDDYMSFYEY